MVGITLIWNKIFKNILCNKIYCGSLKQRKTYRIYYKYFVTLNNYDYNHCRKELRITFFKKGDNIFVSKCLITRRLDIIKSLGLRLDV